MLRNTTITSSYTPEAIADWIKNAVSEEFTDLKGDKYKVQIKVKSVGKKSKSSWHTIKIDPVDKMAADYVKKRDGWRCRLTGNSVSGQLAHCAHVFSRKIHELRYEPNNLLTLNPESHKRFDDGKDLWNDESWQVEWLKEQLGEKVFQDLRIRSQIITKKADAQFKWKMFYGVK